MSGQDPLGMKKAEKLFQISKIYCNGYRHPPEAMSEAEGLFLAKCYLSMGGSSWVSQILNS